MAARRRSLFILYAVALAVPALCCGLIRTFVLESPIDLFWLTEDRYAFLMLILFYPVIEELSFRGVIQGAVLHWTQQRELFTGVTVANGVVSLLFTALHFVHHPPIWAMAVLVPSLIFGYFRDRFDSVIPSVVLHIFYNLIFYSAVGK